MHWLPLSLYLYLWETPNLRRGMNNDDTIPSGNYNLANAASLKIDDVYTPENIIDRFLLDSRPKKMESVELPSSVSTLPPPYLSLEAVEMVPTSLEQQEVTQDEWDELRRRVLPWRGYASEHKIYYAGMAISICGGLLFILFLPFTRGKNGTGEPMLDSSILGENGEDILEVFSAVFSSMLVMGFSMAQWGVMIMHCWKRHRLSSICQSTVLGGGAVSVRLCQDPLDNNADTHLYRCIEIYNPSIWHGPA